MAKEKRKRRGNITLRFFVKSEIVQVTISDFTKDFFNLSSDDITELLCTYLKVEEDQLINVLEDMCIKTGFTLSWIVEYIIIKSHYKDLYATNYQYLQLYTNPN